MLALKHLGIIACIVDYCYVVRKNVLELFAAGEGKGGGCPMEFPSLMV